MPAILKFIEKTSLSKAFKIMALLCLIGLIWWRWQQQTWNLDDLSLVGAQVALPWHLFLLAIVVLLMPLNWGMEAFKWKILLDPIAKETFGRCFRVVLTGLSMNLVAPYAAGDFLSRILHVSKGRRTEAAGAVIVGRVLQLLITLLFGGFALWILWHERWAADLDRFSQYYLAIIGFILILFCLGKPMFQTIKVNNVFQRFFQGMTSIGGRRFLLLLVCAGFRYLIFLFQFWLLLLIFDFKLEPYLMVAGISWIFLAKTLIPSFNFLGNLGVRELSSVYFFEYYGVPFANVLLPGLLLWMINIILPSLMGLYYLNGAQLEELPWK